MEDPSSQFTFEEEIVLSELDRDFEKYVPEAQIKILDNIKIYKNISDAINLPDSDVIAHQIEKGLSDPDKHYSNWSNRILCKRLERDLPNSKVREINIAPPGQKASNLLIREHFQDGLSETRKIEIFKQSLNPWTKDLEYVSYIVNTGDKWGNLIDAIPAGVKFNLRIATGLRRIINNSHYDPQKDTITYSPYNRDRNPSSREETITHEAGHAIAHPISTTFEGDPYHTFNIFSKNITALYPVKSERNAWAFSLAVLHKYKLLGINLIPSTAKISEIIDAPLNSYGASKRKA